MKKIISVIFFSLLSISLFAKISFGSVDLNSSDEVLFTVKQDMTGMKEYSSLFYAKLKDGLPEKTPELLTCYPEKMELLDGGKILQVRNRYGRGHFNTVSERFAWVESESDIPENSLPVEPYAVSPDGKWICKIEKNTLSSGVLIVQNVLTGQSAVLCEQVRLSYESVPVKWAPDSSLVLYENNGNILFCNPDAVIRSVEMDEKYRKIGRGTINSVNWTSEKNLVYVDDYLIYQINSKELYTIGLYSGIIGQGKAIGRFPFQFNPKTDKFSANAAVNSFVVIQNKKLFSYLKLKKNSGSADYLDVVYSSPYTDSTASLIDAYIFWDDKSNPILWLEKLPYDGSSEMCDVFMLSETKIPVLSLKNSNKPSLSPDKRKIAVLSGQKISIFDINTWKLTNELTGENYISAVWSDRNTLFVGGNKSIQKWNLISNTLQLYMLSSAQACLWEPLSLAVIAIQEDNAFYRFSRESFTWKKAASLDNQPQIQNGRYRVFTGTTPNKYYKNALYIRSLSKKPVTNPMYKKSGEKNGETSKVALVFDGYDNADGLSQIISMVKKYNVPGSFFLNGEFIRRYPAETSQIVMNDFSVGSMFFSNTDLVDNPFHVDEEFIRRGLARNEDEFFQCTGKELSLYWHTPFYSVTPDIISHGKKAGYTYINSYHLNNDCEKLDKNISPEKIILDYCYTLRQLGGGIVPVSIGFSQGNRLDPLYNYLDLLICALLDCGFELVSVNEL